MIDGVQFTYHSNNARLTKLPCWEVLVNESTGQKVNDLRTCSIRGMHLQLKPRTNINGFALLANGSLPMWHNCGINNAYNFTFINLIDSIDSVTSALTISPSNCYLHGLEIGVNIPLPYSPNRILQNAICYKGRPFTQINTRQYSKGINASLTDYNVKLYSKTAQSNTGTNILRLEVHLHKMRFAKGYNITTLADLQNPAKVFKLYAILHEALSHIIFTDTKVQLSQLNNREQKQWLAISNPLSWQNLNKFKALRQRKTAKNLIQKHGNLINLEAELLQAWHTAFNGINTADKTLLFHRQNLENEADKNATISQLECTGKRSHILTENTIPQNTSFSTQIIENNLIKTVDINCANTTKNNKNALAKNNNKKNVRTNAQNQIATPAKPPTKCASCGKDISTQRNGSKFCSEAIHGKKAKQCRNKASNKTRTIKRRIAKAEHQNQFLAITYTNDGHTYTDILHPTELSIKPQQWQTIVNVKAMPPP
jgi:hypothetical protein